MTSGKDQIDGQFQDCLLEHCLVYGFLFFRLQCESNAKQFSGSSEMQFLRSMQ